MARKNFTTIAYDGETEESKFLLSRNDDEDTIAPSAPPLDDEPPNYFDISVVPNGAVLFKTNVPPCTDTSQAKIERTSKGVVSFDPLIDRNPDQLWLYFMTYLNEKPQQYVDIHGHHTETYYTTETYTDSDGNTRTRSVTRTREVTDFHFSIDLAPYICDYWWRVAVIRSKEATETNEFVSFRDALEQYTRSDRTIKHITLRKQIHGWDYSRLRQYIVRLVQSTGYHETIDVTFPISGTDIIARSPSTLSQCASSTLVRVLCVISCLWIIFGPIYCCLNHMGKTRDRIVADFSILATPEIFFQSNTALIVRAVTSRSHGRYIANFNS